MTMRLDKAIEILNCRQIPLKTAQDHDFFDAIKLGIEALKEVQRWRKFSPTMIGMHLPGETKEGD